ncbi:MAG: hypothetical protein A2W72_08900 [Burkholderiales bacterium RIFCSPLOWO2_12_67_14]|nr:MAG: hypothetical protein A3I64_11125 [Burkholderiales bacterium RIFCSPLOWO2_02_FULL_67_64]OGB41958.1 MAG: hypothetical protein A3E51_16400 [Burkholderiales bacterium RIFCSPHIGHO2_12_FULL_67_38]OGB48035.1 MAG: hypothetical protein A2W72_08900 [Burkholderiales bacterium RIFCSPLOWO2_12_67_14]OGB84919.1 MAG: hypothetical protein A3G82_22220 [Burkholderiales bacterium RIFCSPLOWO2_12_FULL_67_210]
MFVVLLRFSNNRSQASRFLEGHKRWLDRGFDDGVFLLAGSIQPQQGGGLLAHHTTRQELLARVNEDPFVAEDVVTAEIVEIAPSRMDQQLQSLLG